MESWEEAIRELRGEYIRESTGKLANMESLLALLSTTPSDRNALQELLRRFHGFAGSGATYGFPRVSAIGLEGEKICRATLEEDAPASPESVEHWRGLRDELAAQFPSEAPIPDVPRPTHETPQYVPRPADILVVDDDPAITQMLLKLLSQEGMTGRAASSKAEAVCEIERLRPDGVIVDIILADGSGYELVEHVRHLPNGDLPAVVMLSVRTGFLDKVEAIHCGADGFFEKPVDWDAMIRRLQHLLERNKAEPARILSVEDDPSQGAFLKAVLESAGYEVSVCDDPQRFENVLSATHPDLVLMDILLPGIDGYDLVRYLRQDEQYAALPVLFLSTEAQIEAQIQSARAGADDHLTKPIAPGLLLSTVAARIERSRFLKGLLNRDGLTRLLTHTAFLERARATISRSERGLLSAAWVMIDLDNFKAVNDAHGHPMGDRVLASLSSLLRRRLRQSDTIGRYGGEEFAVILDDLREAEAVRLITRILAEFAREEHAGSGGGTFRVTFSAGVAMLRPSMDLDQWRSAADQALYGAKKAGRNRVVTAPA
jgi:diguanylate cyclase (GGDEF)-like protein